MASARFVPQPSLFSPNLPKGRRGFHFSVKRFHDPLKRVLLLAPYFLPRRRVGAMRPFRFAIHLRAFGWAPTVVTIATPGQRLTPKEARLLEGVEVVELAAPFDRTTRAESQLRLGTQNAPRHAAPGATPPSVADLVDRLVPVDTWMPLFWLRSGVLAETVQRVEPDVLWSTGDPWSSLVTARRLARRFSLPWVADFRDPWTLCDVRPDDKWPVARAADRRYERRVLAAADAVVFTAEATEQLYRAQYADLDLRTTTIPNSFDPALFEDPVDFDTATPEAVSDGGGLRLGFFGRFRALSPAVPVIDVLAALRARHGEAVARRVHIHAFGPLNEADAAYAAERGLLDRFVVEPAVPLERALGALRRFDVLLLSTEPRRDEIIPAKLIEYLAAARPILSLSSNPEVAAILARTGTGVQPGPGEPAAVADLLAEALAARDAGKPLPIPFDPQPEAIARFEARPATRALADLFEAVARPTQNRAR